MIGKSKIDTFSLNEVFTNQNITTSKGENSIFSKSFIDYCSQVLGLSFIQEEKTGNICFAGNNSDMRDDFKQLFTAEDLINYLNAYLHSDFYRSQNLIHYPKSERTFWSIVALGKKLNLHPSLFIFLSEKIRNQIEQEAKDTDIQIQEFTSKINIIINTEL